MNHDTSRYALENGPAEPVLRTCLSCNGTSLAYMGRFSPTPTACREPGCIDGEIELDPEDHDDPPGGEW